MKLNQKTTAYIDGANLHKGVESLGWKLNNHKFRRWLEQKFSVAEAFIFIGLIPKNASLYTSLQKAGFTLVFKEVVYDSDGKAKGNCDVDLTLQVTKDVYERQVRSVLLVASDGDYAPLVRFWKEKNIQCAIVSPARIERCSILLKRTGVPIICLDDVKNKLQFFPK